MIFASLESNSPAFGTPDHVPVTIQLNGESVALQFKRSSRARRYILTVRPNRTVVVTVPVRGSLKRACEFAVSRQAWIERVLRRLPKELPPQSWSAGTEIWFRGRLTRIEFVENDGQSTIHLGPETIEISCREDDLRPALELSLRRMAATELSRRALEFAETHSCIIRRIRIGNQRSRWGSCSRGGTLSLNWRLIQVPHHVRDYILLHELMHLREMNHSSRFWRHVAQVCPDYEQSEAWLREHSFLLNI